MKARSLILFALVALTLAAFAIYPADAQHATSCDPAYVTLNGNMITVQPTGVDDTGNIQCAFDTAVAAGPGAHVHLNKGTFHTAQIVVNGFEGSFTGDGVNRTTIVNLPNLFVTPANFYFEPPSASNPWATLFAFVDGDINIAHLAINIVGDEPTAGWTIFGIDPPVKELAGAIYILGTQANARIEHVSIQGEAYDDAGFLFGYNVINAIFFEGFIGETPAPISGSFEVHHSQFKTAASGTPVVNLRDAEVVISHNKYDDIAYAMDGGDFFNSNITFANNKVSAEQAGLLFYNQFAATYESSTIVIMENWFTGDTGPVVDAAFGEGNHCLLLNNKTQSIKETGIYLGAGTANCFVVADQTRIVDLGTDNMIIGKGNTVSHTE
jgi:hypothetical protein